MFTVYEPETLNDRARMRVLGGIDFDNPALHATLDRVAERTVQRTGMPISLIALVLDTALLILGSAGLDGIWISQAGGIPIEWSFCASAVTTGRPYVLPDTSVCEQAGSPLVTMDGFASAAGVPITLAGHIVGAHCIVSHTAQPFTEAHLDQLYAAAAEISSVLQEFSVSVEPS